MPRLPEPIIISYFASGLYTHRSQFFAPLRSVGINVVSYHDAVIDGLNMELTTLLEWQRSPGFTRYCAQPFATAEIPLAFYSARQPAGTVVNFADTNQKFSFFNPAQIIPLVTKTTTNQGFIQQVGGITYYANGSDLKKWNGGFVANSVSGWGTPAPTVGPTVTPASGNIFWIPSHTYVNQITGEVAIIDSNGNVQLQRGSGATGAFEPAWAISRGQLTPDGAVTWLNCGSLLPWEPSTAYAVSPVPQYVSDTNGNLQQCHGAGTSGATTPSWSTTFEGVTSDGTTSWLCVGSDLTAGNPVTPGQGQITVQFGYVYGYAYRTIFGHLSTLSPLLQTGTALGTYGAVLTGASSTDQQVNQTLDITSVVIVNNVMTCTFAGGASVLSGQAYMLGGFIAGFTFLNGQKINLVSVTATTFTANFTHVNFFGTGTGQAQFLGVEIYRTADGGGILLYDASLQNPFSAATWTYTDTLPDPSLDFELVGPLAHLNDPPPGTVGSLVTQGGTILSYWQGRIWMAVGNKLYFNAGPDCVNGVPEESWPPANVFQYPGPIYGHKPTSQGLLVWGCDYVDMVLGGPQTLSFYPYDLLQNFGISSPNCITQDGDTIWVQTTQGQFFTLNDAGKSEEGTYIADLLDNFPNAGAYVAMHRNGVDAAVYVADGSTTIYRYSLTVGSWSTARQPVGGVGAIASIETSPGTMSLVMGRATPGGYILVRDLNNWQDDGQNYPNCYVTVGNITMSQPGLPLVPLHHVIGYFDAVGTIANPGNPTGPTQPTVYILPNEVAATGKVPFILLPTINQEPPIGQTTPSSTLQQLRWEVNSMNSALVSQLMHHLQVKIEFPPENAPHTIKALMLKPFEDQ